MKLVLIILLTLIIAFSIIAMLYISLYNKLQFYKIRINEAEKVILEELEIRYELLMSIKDIIKKNTKMDLNIFKNLEELKKTNVSSYDFEKKLTTSINIIYTVKEDYPKLEEKKEFKKTITKLQESDTKLNAVKSFYNKNNSNLVALIKKFPSNIVALIHSITIQQFYDGKEIFNEIDDGIKI